MAVSRNSLFPSLIACVVALTVGLVCDYGVRQEQARLDQQQRSHAASALGQFRAALESELNATLYLTNGLVAYVTTRSTLEPEAIEPILKALYDQGRYLRNIGVAPGNRLKYIYPPAGNEKAIGLYYPDLPEQWPDVERAIRERKPRLAGPVELRQGGRGFIYRVPIFIGPEQAYWGLLSTVIDEEQLYAKAGIAPLVKGLQLALRGRDGSGVAGATFLGDAALFATDAVRATITTPGSTWELAVRPEGGWSEAARLNWLRIGAWVLGALLGMLAYLAASASARRRLAESEIENSRNQLNEAQRIARIGSWTLDLRQNSLSWSDETYRIFGVPVGTPQNLEAFSARIHPDDRQRVLSAWEAATRDGIAYSIEHRILVDGDILWVREQAEVTRDANGVPIGGVGTVQDITRQKLAELALAQSLSEQKTILNNDLIGTVRVRNRTIVWANPAFEKMLGYGPGELTGTPTRLNYLSDEAHRAFGDAAYPVLAEGKVYRAQVEHVRKDGQIIWLDFSGSILDAERGESLWGVLDITELKHLEHCAAQSEQRMELALAGAELGLWDLDIPTGKITHNERLLAMAGYHAGEIELSAKSLAMFLHPDDVPAVGAVFHAHLKGETPYFEMEFRVRGQNDLWLWVFGRGKVVERDERGRAIRMTGTTLDVSERKKSEAALRTRETRLATLLGSMQDLVLVLDTGGNVVECFLPQNSHRPSFMPPEQAIGKSYTEIMPPEVADLYGEALLGIIMDGQPKLFEYALTIDGVEYISQATMSALLSDSTYPTGFLTVIHDITSERHSQRQVERLAHHNALLLGSVGEGIYGVDPAYRMTFVNAAARGMLRYAESELLDAAPHELFHHHRPDGTDYPNSECPIRLTIEDGQTRRIDNDWFWRKDGSGFPVAMTVTPVVENGSNVGAVVVFQDITERKANEARIYDLAFYDPLTRLPNRRLLLDRLGLALAKSARNNAHGAILFLDLDNFKTLNDSMGHDYGDLLLEEVGRRLKATVRDEDTVCRLGGDEFVVMLEDLSGGDELASEQALAIGEKILHALCQSYSLRGHSHLCSASIGVSLFKGADVSVGELLKRADTAMYQAKAAGRNTVRMVRRPN